MSLSPRVDMDRSQKSIKPVRVGERKSPPVFIYVLYYCCDWYHYGYEKYTTVTQGQFLSWFEFKVFLLVASPRLKSRICTIKNIVWLIWCDLCVVLLRDFLEKIEVYRNKIGCKVIFYQISHDTMFELSSTTSSRSSNHVDYDNSISLLCDIYFAQLS